MGSGGFVKLKHFHDRSFEGINKFISLSFERPFHTHWAMYACMLGGASMILFMTS